MPGDANSDWNEMVDHLHVFSPVFKVALTAFVRTCSPYSTRMARAQRSSSGAAAAQPQDKRLGSCKRGLSTSIRARSKRHSMRDPAVALVF
jgi:hypothetical protein